MINIAFAPDNNYVMPTTVALTSLLVNNKTEDLCIYIIYLENDLSISNRNIFENLANEFDKKILFKEVKRKALDKFPKFRHGLSAYLRIFTPVLLPDVDKLIYLDGDIIVNKNISELFNIDVSNFEIAGVSDLKQLFDPEYLKIIGFKYNRYYINTGVLLMNLRALRELNILVQTDSYLKKYKDLIYHEDQDILNCICPNILLLPPKYNSIIHLWNKNLRVCKQIWNEHEIKEAKYDPIIIHYLGGLKPWKYEVYHPYKKLWYKYLKKTCFASYVPPYTFRKILSKAKIYIINMFNK